MTEPIQPLPAPAGTHAGAEKSGGAAVALSIGGMAAGLVLASTNSGFGIVGFTLGPSLGRWYNRELGGIGIAGRIVGATLILKGINKLDSGGCEAWSSKDECDSIEDNERRGERYLYLGVALCVGMAFYDIVEAGRGSERWNRKHRVQIAPAMLTRDTPGVSVGMQF